MNRGALYAVVTAGIALAIWHSSVAIKAISIFDNNEPLTSWLTVVLGPALTLVGCILVVIRRPLAGGLTVITAAALSAAAFLIGEGEITEYVAPYLLKFTLPMLVVGVMLVLLARWPASKPAGHAT